MQFRASKTTDIPRLLELYELGRQAQRAIGLHQWGDNYPGLHDAETDIQTGFGRVGEDENGVCLTYTFVETGEPDYDTVYPQGDLAGHWLTGDIPHEKATYVAVHRVTVDPQHRGTGASKAMIAEIVREATEKGFRSIRIDTHKDNIPMRHMLEKNGFTACGVIILTKNGDFRIGYERIL